MPDLVGREGFEGELAAALLLSWDNAQSSLTRGEVPNWQEMEDQIRQRSDPVLQAASVAAAILLFQEMTSSTAGLPPGYRVPNTQASAMAQSLTSTRQNEYASTASGPEFDPDAFADRWFSPAVAHSIAATEVTTAVGAGEASMRQQFESLGVRMEAVWNNDPRSNVCAICLALDGLVESEWPAEARPGPPRHPNCRCYLTYQPAQ